MFLREGTGCTRKNVCTPSTHRYGMGMTLSRCRACLTEDPLEMFRLHVTKISPLGRRRGEGRELGVVGEQLVLQARLTVSAASVS